MPRACIFCGHDSSTLSAEHVFPDWITRFYSDRVAGPLRGTIEFGHPSGKAKFQGDTLSAESKGGLQTL